MVGDQRVDPLILFLKLLLREQILTFIAIARYRLAPNDAQLFFVKSTQIAYFLTDGWGKNFSATSRLPNFFFVPVLHFHGMTYSQKDFAMFSASTLNVDSRNQQPLIYETMKIVSKRQTHARFEKSPP